jgi:transposase-like protein
MTASTANTPSGDSLSAQRSTLKSRGIRPFFADSCAPWAGARGSKSLSDAGLSLRLCAEIDERVRTFLERPIEGDWPYLWIDATYVKVREAGRIVSVAVTIAVAVNTDGRREVLGMAIGPSEAETFWVEFLRKLKRRGLAGVKLVISDAHEGIKAAVARVFRASWQRCRVHFMRNVLAHAGRSGRRVVAALTGRVRCRCASSAPCACRSPFRTSSSSACLPTRLSSAAIRAS